MYQGHLDCSVLAAVSEITIWQQKCTGTKNALKKCNILIFPFTFKLLLILANFPVTTANSE
jgi:hypothetical protein